MPYVGNSLADLIVTEPAGIAPVAVGDDALRQIKRYLVNTLGDPAAAGTAYDAILAAHTSASPAVGTVSPHADFGVWTAPTSYLKCDGNTIGDVSSGAFYESEDYETLFELVKQGFGNAGTEVWATGDTVNLPLVAETALVAGDPLFSAVDSGASSATLRDVGVKYEDNDVQYDSLELLAFAPSTLKFDDAFSSLTHIVVEAGMEYVSNGQGWHYCRIDSIYVSFDGGTTRQMLHNPGIVLRVDDTSVTDSEGSWPTYTQPVTNIPRIAVESDPEQDYPTVLVYAPLPENWESITSLNFYVETVGGNSDNNKRSRSYVRLKGAQGFAETAQFNYIIRYK